MERARYAGAKGLIVTLDWSFATARDWGSPPIPEKMDLRTNLEVVLRTLVDAGRLVADELTPFLPGAAQRVAAQLGDGGDELDKPTPLFPRIELPAEE
ncbi:dehydrogenase [Saccharopolyspora spinosa]